MISGEKMENAEIIKKLSVKYKDECEKHGIKSTDTDANIFEILQIENKEVLFCRFLGYVLDPKSKLNNNSNQPVKLFIEKVLGYKEITDEYEFSAQLEEPTEKKRRVDIVIHAGNMVFPLEVKINAGDQPSQLYDYYHHYFGKNQREPNCVYYLTPMGKEPSAESITKIDENNNKHRLEKENYELVGYGSNIFMNWLDSVERIYKDISISQFLIQQYKAEVKSIVKSEEIAMALDESLSLTIDNENNDEFENNKELLIDILKNADDIKTKIQRKYLLKNIKGLEGFVLSKEISESDISKDKYCILKINRKSDNKTVAWIAVETYLYIIAEDLKESAKTTDDPGKNPKCWEKAKPNYSWRYILVKNKKFKLNDIEKCRKDQDIDLKSILSDIKINDLTKE